MTKNQVKIGEHYLAKISGKVVEVKLLTANLENNRYSVRNLNTNRVIILRGSVARLRPCPPSIPKK